MVIVTAFLLLPVSARLTGPGCGGGGGELGGDGGGL